MRLGVWLAFTSLALVGGACGITITGSGSPTVPLEDSGVKPSLPPPPDDDPGSSDASSDAEALVGWCAGHASAIFCDDFDQPRRLGGWTDVQMTNDNRVELSEGQFRSAPNSLRVTTTAGGIDCEKAVVHKLFAATFDEAELSFDVYPTTEGRSVMATFYLADTSSTYYRIEATLGKPASLQEVTQPSIPRAPSSFDTELPNGKWTRVALRFARQPAPGTLTVLYDGDAKHTMPLSSSDFTEQHRLLLGDFCAKEARSVYFDNVLFEKIR